MSKTSSTVSIGRSVSRSHSTGSPPGGGFGSVTRTAWTSTSGNFPPGRAGPRKVTRGGRDHGAILTGADEEGRLANPLDGLRFQKILVNISFAIGERDDEGLR